MSRDQAAKGHDVTVLTVRNDPNLPHFEKSHGYTVIRYDPDVSLLGNDISSEIANHLYNTADFDVLHAHSHLYFSTNLAALKRRLGDIPLAITNHGLYSQTAPKRIFDWYLRTIGQWTFNQADVVFCYTAVEKDRLREFGVNSKIVVVSNGIDTDRFTPRGPESDLLDSDGPNMLFVGRLVDGKRPRDALEAAQTLREEYPDLTLYFCGEGPLRESLEQQASDQLDDTIVFLGHLPYDEMPKVYRSADLLALPSSSEGVPRTVLEAIASGTPVVCSDLPQMDAIVGDAGELVPVGDTAALAEKSISLLRADLRPELEPRYEWSRTVDQTTEILERVRRDNV